MSYRVNDEEIVHTVKDHVARFVKTYCYLIIAYLVCTFTGLHVGAFENPLT